MSSIILTFLAKHILELVESELIKEEPALIAATTQDVRLLIAKLESLISSKSAPNSAVSNMF